MPDRTTSYKLTRNDGNTLATDARILALLLADTPAGAALEFVPRAWGRLDRSAAAEGRALSRLRQLAPVAKGAR